MYARDLFGVGGQTPSYGVAAPTQGMGVDLHAAGWRALVDPHNPLLWFGVFLAVTVGAAGVAGSVRLGKAKLSGSLDKG